MNPDAKSASEDLAFMRALVEERGQGLKSGGELYAAAGVLYGVQCLLTWFMETGLVAGSTLSALIIGFLPTVVFLALIFYVLWRDRRAMQIKGIASRAISAAFTGSGIANISMVIVFAVAAAKRSDFSIWLFYPVVVCAIQGAVWYAVANIQRRVWMGVVAGGWYLTAITTGLLIPTPSLYVLVMGLALFAFMAVPGVILMRSAKGE